jgi:hypothetical protein
MDLTGETDGISVLLDDGAGVLGSFAERRVVPAELGFNAGTRFTLRMERDLSEATSPRGFGYATMVIDAVGAVNITGSLPDGRPFTMSSILSRNGRVPLYGSMISGAASLAGSLQIESTADTDLSGSVRWQKPARAGDRIHPEALNTLRTLRGSLYTPPSADMPAVTFGTIENRADLALDDGGLFEEVRATLQVLPRAIAIVRGNPANFKVTINPANGRFTGTFVAPETAVVRKINGVVLQKQHSAAGYFLGSDESGTAELLPSGN